MPVAPVGGQMNRLAFRRLAVPSFKILSPFVPPLRDVPRGATNTSMIALPSRTWAILLRQELFAFIVILIVWLGMPQSFIKTN